MMWSGSPWKNFLMMISVVIIYITIITIGIVLILIHFITGQPSSQPYSQPTSQPSRQPSGMTYIYNTLRVTTDMNTLMILNVVANGSLSSYS
jgi:hypothetical protein